MVRNKNAIFNLGFVEERWENVDGLLPLDPAVARLKRERSSCSSGGGIGMEWGLEGMNRGARRKRIGSERRREKARTNGVENMEGAGRGITNLRAGNCEKLKGNLGEKAVLELKEL